MKNHCKYIIGKLLMSVTYFMFSKKNGYIGRFIEFAYRKLFEAINLSYYPVVNASLYQTKTGNVTLLDLVTNRDGVSGNISYWDDWKEPQLKAEHLDDIRLHEYKDVFITGDSDVIVDVKNKLVVSDVCYNIDDNLEFIDGLLYRHKNNLCLLRNNMKGKYETIASGIMISGKFSKNYYHTMVENFPRLLLIDDSKIPIEVPFIVDEIVFSIPSFKQIFEILTKESKRKIIKIRPNDIYKVQELYYIDHVNRIIPNLRDISLFKEGLVAFDKNLTVKYREILLNHMSSRKFPERIFLSRQNAKYRKFNENEIMDILKPYGFVSISPECLTFEEQVSLFHGAKWIIGGTGAAFTNVLFCSEGCKILCIRATNIRTLYPEFTTMSCLNKCDMTWFLECKGKNRKSDHSDCNVDVEELKNYISQTLSP